MHPKTELCRCFVQPIEEPPEPKKGGDGKKITWRDVILPEIVEVLKPYAHRSLTFDVETTVDAHSGQVARILFWQDHGLRYADRCALFAEGLLTPEVMDVCWGEGVAYSPDTNIVSSEEAARIRAYAAKRGLSCMTIPDFITKVFYQQAWLNSTIPEPKLILGHNVVFDIGALSHHTGQSRDKDMYGALSFGLCDCRKAEIEARLPHLFRLRRVRKLLRDAALPRSRRRMQ